MGSQADQDAIQAAIEVIDHNLALTANRTLVSSTEQANVLLDIRNIVVKLRKD